MVSEMFEGGYFGSKDSPLLAPLPTSFFFPSLRIQEYPSMQSGSLPVCLCQSQIWVTELLSTDASVSLTNQGEKNTDSLNECILFTLKYGLFMLIEWASSCICVFDIDLSWVGSVHA